MSILGVNSITNRSSVSGEGLHTSKPVGTRPQSLYTRKFSATALHSSAESYSLEGMLSRATAQSAMKK